MATLSLVVAFYNYLKNIFLDFIFINDYNLII